MKVTDEDIPPPISGHFLRQLKANIDYETESLTWKELGPDRVSQLSVLPSDHITCRVDESRDGKWMDPRLAATVICDDTLAVIPTHSHVTNAHMN